MNKKIVGYTTGVFDMFHIGHLNILKKAKQNCDHLIVGVSTDELVESYKNKKPIISFEHRCEIVSALQMVDEVIAQESRDKISQFKAINYDLLFVGDDWKGSSIFTQLESVLNKAGARIMYFNYTKDISSTKLTTILQKIYDEESNFQ